mgnify:CR=1 FL=1
MSPFERFAFLAQELARFWDMEIAPPVQDHAVQFSYANGSRISLHLAEDALVLGACVPLATLCAEQPVLPDQEALHVFLLRRNFAERLSGQTRYAWTGENDGIAALRSISLAEAEPGQLFAAVEELAIRLDAIREVLPLLDAANPPSGHAAHPADLQYA